MSIWKKPIGYGLNVFFACLAPSTQLVTDTAAKVMLVNELGLQFDFLRLLHALSGALKSAATAPSGQF
jgi:hypothetical protein